MKNLAKLISIEGNIGSGKSTLLKLLLKNLNSVQVIAEPVDIWQKTNLLHLYYQDPHRWAYTFQTFALFSRLEKVRNALKTTNSSTKYLISERSIEADREIFAELLYRKGYINQTEKMLYDAEFQGFRDVLQLKPVDLIVYLRCTPEKCYERLQKRGRSQEANKVTLEYLKQLHQRHEEWLANHPRKVVIDGDREFQTDDSRFKQLLQGIRQSIDKI